MPYITPRPWKRTHHQPGAPWDEESYQISGPEFNQLIAQMPIGEYTAKEQEANSLVIQHVPCMVDLLQSILRQPFVQAMVPKDGFDLTLKEAIENLMERMGNPEFAPLLHPAEID